MTKKTKKGLFGKALDKVTGKEVKPEMAGGIVIPEIGETRGVAVAKGIPDHLENSTPGEHPIMDGKSVRTQRALRDRRAVRPRLGSGGRATRSGL